MDTFQFINSKDIREHLKSIHYAFTSLETAWLIRQCRNISWDEKNEAWRELIRTMPDQKIEERRWTREWPSLFGYLEKVMSYEKRLYDVFCNKTENAVYTCSVYLKNRIEEYHDYIFSAFEKCQDFLNQIYDSEKVIKFKVHKRFADNEFQYVAAEFNHRWELNSIWQNGKAAEDICAEMDDFQGMWFSFPTPFEKGDIVVNSDPYDVGFGSGPFVLNEIPPNDEAFIKHHQKDADNSDMIAAGYFQEDDGSIYYECSHSYMDLEYYRGELKGKRRILKALSSFQKGRIDIGLYSKAYYAILLDEFAKSSIPQYYTDSGMELAGLKF